MPHTYEEIDSTDLNTKNTRALFEQAQENIAAVKDTAEAFDGAFTDLSDTPQSYTDLGGKLLAVKGDESGVEAIDPPASEFIALTDAPSSYAGQAKKIVKVNDAEDALEFGLGGNGDISPVGALLMFSGASAPDGWLICDGKTIGRDVGDEIFPDASGSGAPDYYGAEYEALFNVLSEDAERWETPAGAAVWGTHKIKLPNMQDVFLRGEVGNAASIFTDSTKRSAGLGKKQDDAMQGHYHNPLSAGAFLNTQGGPTGAGGSAITADATTGAPVTDGTNGTPRTGAETVPKNVGVNVIIKYAYIDPIPEPVTADFITKTNTNYVFEIDDGIATAHFVTGSSDRTADFSDIEDMAGRYLIIIKGAGSGKLTLMGSTFNGYSSIDMELENTVLHLKCTGAGFVVVGHEGCEGLHDTGAALEVVYQKTWSGTNSGTSSKSETHGVDSDKIIEQVGYVTSSGDAYQYWSYGGDGHNTFVFKNATVAGIVFTSAFNNGKYLIRIKYYI